MTEHDNKVYLNHIVDSIIKTKNYIGELSFDEFVANDMLVDAVIRNLEIIGEASSKIAEEFKNDYPEANFRAASDMRNRLIHGYDDINYDFIWLTAQKDLPKLKKQIETILGNIS